MHLFIGHGFEFLNDHMQLNPNSKESDWDQFQNQNPDFYYFRFAHLFSDHPLFFIMYNEKEIIGVLKTQRSSFYQEKYPFQGINYISVKDKYQNKGIARQLYEAMFKYFSNGFIVGTDYETNDSQLKLEKMSYRLAKENKVYFLTRQNILRLESHLPTDINELYLLPEYNNI
jgi:GNAT superfamily N-acetyltransferase